MRIAVVGGGPGGLLAASLLRTRTGAHVTLFERNRADDTFGFGVVFSGATLGNIDAADPVLGRALLEHGRHWDTIEVRLKGERFRAAGNAMSAVVRTTLLALLQRAAERAGVHLHFSTPVTLDELTGYDLVVAADGASSSLRQQLAGQLEPSFDEATAKFVWFGTDHLFEGLTFVHERSEHGVFAVHGYPISDRMSTFIVETDEATWRRAGLDAFHPATLPGASDETSRRYLQELFADSTGGGTLVGNNSRWASFRTRRSQRWRAGNVVLLGDAAHTAHFSVGSGTKMAMEDAIALADCLTGVSPAGLPVALDAYEAAARPSVERIQGSAGPSLSWWEHFGRSHDALPAWQFAFHFFSRSMDTDRMRRRSPDFVEASLTAWRDEHCAEPLDAPLAGAPGRVLVQRDDRLVTPDGSAAARLVPDAMVPDAMVPDAMVPDAMVPDAMAGEDAGPWALALTAPSLGVDMTRLVERARAAVDAGACLVVVHEPSPPGEALGAGEARLAAVLLAEACRLGAGLPVALVCPGWSTAAATTAVLAGRTDAVVLAEGDEAVRERALAPTAAAAAP